MFGALLGVALSPVLEDLYREHLWLRLMLVMVIAVGVSTAYVRINQPGLHILLSCLILGILPGALILPGLEALFQNPLLVFVVVFLAGLAASYALFKIATCPKTVRDQATRIFLLEVLAAMVVALAIWPIFCTAFLFVKREYLLGSIPFLYAFPYCFGIALVIKPIIAFVMIARKDGADAARAQYDAWREQWKLKCSTEIPTEVINKYRAGLFWKHVSRLLAILQSIALAPRIIYLFAVVFRFGRSIPFLVDFDTPFFALSALVAYLIASAHHPVVALILSADLFLLKLYEVTSPFDSRSGVLKLLLQDKRQPRLSDIAFAAAIMATSFGCIHYCISILNPSAYSRPLTAIDGLCFSVITFATVGYGDIYPTTHLSKLACIGEIASGCLVLLFGVNLAMMVWFQKVTDSPAGGTDRSAANGQPTKSESEPASGRDS